MLPAKRKLAYPELRYVIIDLFLGKQSRAALPSAPKRKHSKIIIRFLKKNIEMCNYGIETEKTILTQPTLIRRAI